MAVLRSDRGTYLPRLDLGTAREDKNLAVAAQSCFGSMYRYTIRPQRGHGLEIQRGSAFHAWLQ